VHSFLQYCTKKAYKGSVDEAARIRDSGICYIEMIDYIHWRGNLVEPAGDLNAVAVRTS
jgi:hypothetical protein